MADFIDLTRIDHAGITVKDFQAAADWYKYIFGFEIINKWDNAWLVGRGCVKLGLFLFPDAEPIPNPNSRIIIRKIAFAVDGNAYTAALDTAKAKGLEITLQDDTGIAYRFQFSDLDGNLLEVTAFHG